jgi:hypothetical protein
MEAIKDLMQRAAKCAPKYIKAQYFGRSGMLYVTGDEVPRSIGTKGSNVENGAGFMVLIACINAEYDRLFEKDDLSDEEETRLLIAEDFLCEKISFLSTRFVLESFCAVFEGERDASAP